jgi:hypothetical protein
MMRNRILAAYSGSVFGTTNAPKIYVADFTKRTHNARGVEIHELLPKAPNDATTDMDCCIVINRNALQIDYNIFKDNQFKNEEDEDMKHGECCLFPSTNNERTWILFIEIKDCKGSRIFKYKQDVKDKLILNVGEFRKHGIILDNNVYGVVAFPRKKTAFNEMIISDYTEYKKFYKEYGIHFAAVNEISINNDVILDFYK